MHSTVKKRSLVLHGHKTSISLEDEFWAALIDIAAEKRLPVPLLVEQIDSEHDHLNLSSAVRVFVFRHYRAARRETPLRTDGLDEVPSDATMRGEFFAKDPDRF